MRVRGGACVRSRGCGCWKAGWNISGGNPISAHPWLQSSPRRVRSIANSSRSRLSSSLVSLSIDATDSLPWSDLEKQSTASGGGCIWSEVTDFLGLLPDGGTASPQTAEGFGSGMVLTQWKIEVPTWAVQRIWNVGFSVNCRVGFVLMIRDALHPLKRFAFLFYGRTKTAEVGLRESRYKGTLRYSGVELAWYWLREWIWNGSFKLTAIL